MRASAFLPLVCAFACSGSDDPPTSAPTPAAWSEATAVSGAALLSVWGTAPSSFVVVGGPLGNGTRDAIAWRGEGTKLVDLAPGGADSLWWAHGRSADDLWIVGEGGRMVHVANGVPTEAPRITTATLWGVSIASATEGWAVGGTPGKGPFDVVLAWDGATWKPETLPGPPRGAALFKVWSASDGDVFVVGEGATAWRRHEGAWTLTDVPQGTGSLRTVHGCSPTDVWAVGGKDVLRWDGAQWSRVSVDVGGVVNGVHCGKDGVMLVGSGGTKLRLRDGKVEDFSLNPPFTDLHAVWGDDAGTFWAAGGDFVSAPQPGKARPGVLARFGAGAPSIAAP